MMIIPLVITNVGARSMTLDNIIQWNLQSLKTKFSELKLLINEHLPICICLQETLAHLNKISTISGYHVFHSIPVRNDGHERGASILVNKKINFENIQLSTNLQAVAIKVILEKTYTICSLYLPHIDITKNEIESLISQLQPPFLLMGDFNARHQLWGDSISNGKGDIVEQLIMENDINILNDGSATHYHIQTNSYTVIDLTISSSDCCTDFEYGVMESLHGSDHYPIKVTLNNNPEVFSRPSKYNFKKADWSLFRDLSENNEDIEHLEIDEIVEIIETSIINSANASIPTTSQKITKPPVPWWNDAIKRSKEERNRAERRLKRGFSIEKKIIYNRTKAKLLWLCNKARKQSWIQYLTTMNQYTTLFEIWEKVNKISGKYKTSPTPMLEVNNIIYQDHTDVSEILANSFAKISADENYSTQFLSHKREQEKRKISFQTTNQFVYNDHITLDEINSNLATTEETTPGIDKITYSMLKHIHPSLLTKILILFNLILLKSYYPTRWRTAIIIPIPKPKKDHKDPTNYRPISLTCCLSKLMEKIINERLTWYLEKYGHITKHQSGFRANRSTIDSIMELEHYTLNAMAQRKHTIAIFFDLTKAYDTAWRHNVIMKLHQFGMRGYLPKFIQNFIIDRNIVVRVGNTLSNPKKINEGILQGSVLSCTCFLIAINDITNNLDPAIKCSLYVDDFAIYTSGAIPHIIERRLQTAINTLQRWCHKTGFTFSPEKTSSLHICHKHLCSKTSANLTLNGSNIKSVESYKHLGVTFDSSLSWRPHIKELRIKCSKVLGLMKHLSHKTWGADRTTLLRLYTSLLKPKIEYGCEAYASAKLYLLKGVDTIQNQAIRIGTGAYRSSPIPSLCAESGIPPLSYARDQKTLNYLMRIKSNVSHPMNEILNEESIAAAGNCHLVRTFKHRSELLLQEYNLNLECVIPDTYENPKWTGNVTKCESLLHIKKSEYTDIQLRAMFEEHLESHMNGNFMFTDGSKTRDGVGCAAVNQNITIYKKLNPISSVYTAELHAIKEAIYHEASKQSESLTIITDSKSSIQGIINCKTKNPIIKSIRNQTISFENGINLCWVPSHIGVLLNERADKAANKATSKLSADITEIPRSDMKNHIKMRMFHKWREKWENTTNNKYRLISPHIKPLPCATSRNRLWERTLTRLRIGHSQLTHSYLMSGDQQTQCESCDVPLTIHHIITECVEYNRERLIHLGRARPDLKTVLASQTNYCGGPLYNFISSTQLLNRL